jgi:hypothetical protein
MADRLKWTLIAGAAVVALAVGGSVASAVGGGNGEKDDGSDDTPVTGSTADQVRDAAEKAADGGRVLEVEPDGDPGGADSNGSERDDADSADERDEGGRDDERDYAYEVTVERPDGKVVELQIDKDLKVQATDTDD